MRVVLVTGGTKGIGRAVCERFEAGGDRVVPVGRDVCDVTDESQVEQLFGEVGPVDVLVNNAGIAHSNPVGKVTLAEWNHHLSVNATGAFLCTRAALHGMLERDSGRLITVASTAGKVGAAYTAAYTASKHAAVGLMRAVAAEVAGSGITANAVCPGFVRTELTARSIERIVKTTRRTAEDAAEMLSRSAPLGRLLEPEEVAEAVWYLASPAAAGVNGQALVIDGGGVQS